MDLRRRGDTAPHLSAQATPSDSVDRLAQLRREGHELLAAGDDAIDRALSGDSETFNTAVRQQGGQ